MAYANIRRSARSGQHLGFLKEILALFNSERGHYYGQPPSELPLRDFRSKRIWDLLVEADECGLPMVQYGKAAGPVVVSREPMRPALSVSRGPGGIVLTPTLSAGRSVIDTASALLIGAPPHGVAWWAAPAPPALEEQRVLWLAPMKQTERGLSGQLGSILSAQPIRVPPRDEVRFFDDFYPSLVDRVEIVADDSIELPTVGCPRLILDVSAAVGRPLSLDWVWQTPVGRGRRVDPLRPSDPADMAGKGETIQRVIDIVGKSVPDMIEHLPTGDHLALGVTIDGDQMIRFLVEVLPQLEEMNDIEVRVPVELRDRDYHQSYHRPVVTFADTTGIENDWFDLAVEVTVGGEQVVFHELFAALAQERQYLLLPSGAYFDLDQPELHQLRELIVESRALADSPPDTVRVGRFQVGLWNDLTELGEITGEAAQWHQSIQSLLTGTGPQAWRDPRGLTADLRPYQREGVRWLADRFDRGLGAVLADDMGLGKTLQALALICHAREQASAKDPFLVVAPASVVPNWIAEAERFAPTLKARAISQTKARRESELGDVCAGADLVVTSYTLFRLEFDDYASLGWSGLVLDEAQFVKNPQSEAYRCARRLPSPFKLGITGTPMENNLTELWSLCSISSPGLFPRLDRFTEFFRKPIERDRDAQRLDHLRRRLRPFMLRRGKSDVAVDLPAKQEQVIELELERRHRKLYQTYLQRERQKVLGLLSDLKRNRFEIFRSLTLLRQASLDVSLVDPRHAGVPSTKLDELVERASGIAAEGHRTLVFSQFTRFLARARDRLERAGLECCYLDGKTRDRARVIAEFRSGTAPVFLISLKAGGFGLNLTEADYCILLDPWWNPATEAQAVDRIHRIGQLRNVMVYRLAAKDTIEEKVMALKARKAELFRSVLDDGDFANVRLTEDDIRALLS